ncbi:hypothetical protein AA313_de0209340 [Arthrobotrys entomopaga]|nr:hypothetical protein AA313_de0209340 [Arthrobotrys entomopaga]
MAVNLTFEGLQRPMAKSTNIISEMFLLGFGIPDLPKLIEGLKLLSKAEFGALSSLENEYAANPLSVSSDPPNVQYRETITLKTGKDNATSKSPNDYNQIFLRAEPMEENLAYAIESDKLNAGNYLSMSRTLVKDFGWNTIESRKVWAFGPRITDSNILVDATKGVRPLSEEPAMQSIRFNITDMTLSADEITREPVYPAEIQVPEPAEGEVYNMLTQRNFQVIDEKKSGGRYVKIKACLPVKDTFGLTTEMLNKCHGDATSQLIFDHWQPMTLGNLLDTTSSAHELALSIRKKKA